MNTKVKKTLFWGAIATPMVLGVNFLIGGVSALAAGPHGHGPGEMGGRGGMGMAGQAAIGGGKGDFGGAGFADFGGHPMMAGAHHGGGFSWLGILLFIVIAAAIVIFLTKWLRKKSKASSMQQFIDTSIMTSPRPVMNQNGSTLDQWEKSVLNLNKKENE